jgi:hypothetical protein
MLTTYDRYLRDYRAKLLKARLERPVPQLVETETVPGVKVVQAARQAVKDTMRNMEGQ